MATIPVAASATPGLAPMARDGSTTTVVTLAMAITSTAVAAMEDVHLSNVLPVRVGAPWVQVGLRDQIAIAVPSVMVFSVRLADALVTLQSSATCLPRQFVLSAT